MELQMILAGIILFFAVLVWDLKTDYNKWKKGERINHANDALLRFALLTPSIVCFSIPLTHLWEVVIVLAMEFFVYWFGFDGFFNLLRKFNWTFTGSDEGKKDAWLDRVQRRMGPVVSQILKISGCFLMIFWYVKSV